MHHHISKCEKCCASCAKVPFYLDKLIECLGMKKVYIFHQFNSEIFENCLFLMSSILIKMEFCCYLHKIKLIDKIYIYMVDTLVHFTQWCQIAKYRMIAKHILYSYDMFSFTLEILSRKIYTFFFHFKSLNCYTSKQEAN